MLKIVLLAFLLGGCNSLWTGTNEEIAQCVQTCKGINARMDDGVSQTYGMYCACKREFRINKEANSVTEVTHE